MQEGTIEYRLNLNSALSDFLLSEPLENTLFEGAALLEQRANSIPNTIAQGRNLHRLSTRVITIGG